MLTNIDIARYRSETPNGLQFTMRARRTATSALRSFAPAQVSRPTPCPPTPSTFTSTGILKLNEQISLIVNLNLVILNQRRNVAITIGSQELGVEHSAGVEPLRSYLRGL